MSAVPAKDQRDAILTGAVCVAAALVDLGWAFACCAAAGGAAGPRRLVGVTALLALVPLACVVWWMHTHSTDGLIRDVAISGGPSKATDIANLLANAIVTTIVSGVIVGLILLTAVVTVIVAAMSSLPPAMGCKCILVGRLDLLTTQSGVRHFSGALKATIEARAHGR